MLTGLIKILDAGKGSGKVKGEGKGKFEGEGKGQALNKYRGSGFDLRLKQRRGAHAFQRSHA